jgi:hypothetical protein
MSLNVDYDELDGTMNVHDSIKSIMESNRYWKNQYKKKYLKHQN